MIQFCLFVGLSVTASNSFATVVLSDSFSRAPASSTLGTPPNRDTSASAQADAGANWVSNWGQNNNSAGGYVNQTYTSYQDALGENFKVDGMNGISGNWLNNGSPTHPLKLGNAGATITEPIGLTGFAWVQIDHDFAADSQVAAADKLRIEFDFYRTPGGNISWFLGQSDDTGVANGNAGSPAVITSNDISLYFRGFQAGTFGLRDNGLLPAPVPGIASYDTISYASGTNMNAQPIAVQIEIAGTDFNSGSTSALDLWVSGVQQDLNGTADGTSYTFTWDAGGSAYMGFASNNTPVEGTIAAPVYRASGIDNLVVSLLGTTALVGDYNQDDNVDAADYVQWRKNVGAPAGTLGPGDTAGGPIGTAQYDLWKLHFGETSGAGSSIAVPEPCVMICALIASFTAVALRSGRIQCEGLEPQWMVAGVQVLRSVNDKVFSRSSKNL